jgi:hypothetical protein
MESMQTITRFNDEVVRYIVQEIASKYSQAHLWQPLADWYPALRLLQLDNAGVQCVLDRAGVPITHVRFRAATIAERKIKFLYNNDIASPAKRT